MGVTVLVFVVELQKVRTKCIFQIFERGLGRVSKFCFYRIYIEMSQLGHSVIKKVFE